MPNPEQLAEAAFLIGEQQRRARYKFHSYFPETGPRSRACYPRQIEFFRAGLSFKERLFMAANRVGKTDAGSFEVTCHATGLYPDWWDGRRFDGPVEIWACGTTGETTRDIVQQKLYGPFDAPGTGMLPGHLITHTQRRVHGLANTLEAIWVRHVSGRQSLIGLKTYEQGRKSFEGTEKHVIWCDEEPPEDCYTEMLYRTVTSQGIVLTTFTPLQGMSAVVMGFLEPQNEEARASKHVVMAGWDDVPHLEEAEKRMLLATTPPFQRDARTKGMPQLGAGAIYQMPESEFVIAPITIPVHWPRYMGLDTGDWTAGVWVAYDREADVHYIYDVYKREWAETAVHIAAIKARGLWIPGAADAAASILTEHDREQLILLYKRAGVDIILADKSVETGIQDVWDLLSTGRLRVFRQCEAWLKEYRLYHRNEKGQIVKTNDHLMDATRYAVRTGRGRMKTRPAERPKPVGRPAGTPTGQGWMQ